MDRNVIDGWLDTVKESTKTRTFERYKEIMNTHVLPFLEDKDIEQLGIDEWEDFVLYLSKSGNKRTGKKLSDNSIAQIVGVVKRFYRYLVKIRLVAVNPVADLSVHIKQKQMEVLTEYEQRKIERDIIGRHSYRDYGVIIALYTGLRIGELLALEWNDVDLKQRRITVKKTMSVMKVSQGDNPYLGTPKTDSGSRTVPIPKTIIPLLSEMKKRHDKYVISGRFGGFVMVSSYQKSFGKLLNRLKINHRGFHCLRHTFATRAVEHGADMKTLSEILGHSSPTVTMNRYVHSSERQKIRIMDKVGAALKVD